MLRFSLICGLLLVPAARANTTWEESDDGELTIIRIAATPADAPTPLLKYRFGVQPSKRTHGNAAADYRRVFAENGLSSPWKTAREQFPSSLADGGEAGVDDWYGTDFSLDALPVASLRPAAALFDSVVENYVRPATSRRDCDWDMPTLDLSGPELIAMLLPEFQGMRSISRAVNLKIRLALCERRYDDAIDLMRMNYTLGQDTAKEPLLVCSLVGMAICGMTNNTVLDHIGAPDSPNLYWALTALPRPLVPIREAIEVEMELGKRTITILDGAEDANFSYDEWNARWKRWARVFNEDHLWMDPSELSPAMDVVPALVGIAGYTHAKQRMIAWGYDADRVEAMPVGQVLTLYASRVYQELADQMEVSHSIPFAKAQELYGEANRALRDRNPLSNHPDRELLPVASMLLPAVGAARAAEARVDRDIAALRILEALRMHAARNDGELPESLEDVTCVPVPKNPATGAAFDYQLEEIDGTPTAVLNLPKSNGVRPAKRFELSIR